MASALAARGRQRFPTVIVLEFALIFLLFPHRPSIPDTYMKPAAVQGEKAKCRNDGEWPKSCREKFVQAWKEKLKNQHSTIVSSQQLEHQTASDIPTLGNGTRDKSCSHLQSRAILQPSDNALYVLTVVKAPQGQQYSNPVSFLASRHYPLGLPIPHPIRELELLDKELASSSLDWQTRTEEELIHICVSDLLLKSPVKKRPRLLPPNRKMYMEVLKKPASRPVQEDERSPVPLEYSHLLDNMSLASPEDLPEVESFYRSFTTSLRQQVSPRPVYPLGECPSPASGLEAATDQQSIMQTTRRSHEQNLLHSPKINGPLSSLTMASQESMNASQNGHLPPKKRYTRSCL